MDTQTIAPVAAQARSRPASWAAYLGAAALAAGAGWHTLAVKGVTVAEAPHIGAGVPEDRGLHIFYRWLVTTLPQERFYSALAIVGFASLAAVAAVAWQVLGRDRALARAGAIIIAAGAAIWVTGSLVELGGHQAVGLMATHHNPIRATNSIAFTIDMIGQTFALAAFAFICAGMLAFAWLAVRAGRRAWAGWTLLLGLMCLVTAWSYAAGNGDVTDLMLLADGVAVTPLWMVWTSRLT